MTPMCPLNGFLEGLLLNVMYLKDREFKILTDHYYSPHLFIITCKTHMGSGFKLFICFILFRFDARAAVRRLSVCMCKGVCVRDGV